MLWMLSASFMRPGEASTYPPHLLPRTAIQFPLLHPAVAAVILTIVALTVGTTEAVITVIIQLVYQQIENYVVYPIVYRQAVELSGFTTIVAVLIAGSLLGVVGAILAVPFAAVIKTVLREAGAPRRARMAALREG